MSQKTGGSINEKLPELPGEMGIGYINGIRNSPEEAMESARYLSRLAGGYNVRLVYNATHGAYADLFECSLGLDYIATDPVPLLHQMWNSHLSRSPEATFLMICHSQGVIHVRNALLDYPPELRERILVVAVAPGGYVYEETCARVIHYRVAFWRDLVPRRDRKGAQRVKKTIVEIKSHPDAKLHDHGLQSETYEEPLQQRIINYVLSLGRYI